MFFVMKNLEIILKRYFKEAQKETILHFSFRFYILNLTIQFGKTDSFSKENLASSFYNFGVYIYISLFLSEFIHNAQTRQIWARRYYGMVTGYRHVAYGVATVLHR